MIDHSSLFQNEEREKERRRQAEQQEANGLKTDTNQEEEEDNGGKQPDNTRQTPDSSVSGDLILLKKQLFKGCSKHSKCAGYQN